MNRCALAVLVCLLFASISFAQQSAADAPASREDIEKYLDMMHARDLAVSTMNAMTKQMHQMIHASWKSSQTCRRILRRAWINRWMT
jgi:hypothetical protein